MLVVACARAEMPELLRDALQKEREQECRWAYTETQEIYDGKGRLKETAVIRYDPSRPYAEQYTPVSVDGKTPPRRLVKDCQERGEAEARKRHKQLEEPKSDEAVEIELGEEKGVLHLDQAKPVQQTELTTTYKIPVVAKKKGKVPFEKISVLIETDSRQRVLARLNVRMEAPLRINLVAKIRGAAISGDYTRIDAEHPPQLTSAAIHADISFLFSKSVQRVVIRRSDFKRVKPYDERFVVRSGPLKSLGF